MTPKQHFRALQIRLEIAEFGMGMPLDRERVKGSHRCSSISANVNTTRMRPRW